MTELRWLPGPLIEKWGWQARGACRQVDTTMFFHPESERGSQAAARIAAAKAICARCPVRPECAAHALASREPYGVWGGLSEVEREQMLAIDAYHHPTPVA